MTNFKANVKSATVNIHKKEITVSLVMHLDEENMRRAEEIAFYIGKGELNVVAAPRQLPLPLPGGFDSLPIEGAQS